MPLAEDLRIPQLEFLQSPKLLERFGAPTDDNYETWFAASSFLAYGGVLDVVRNSGSTLTHSSVGGQANLRIDNSVAYEGAYYTGSMTWEWAARTAGAQGNALKVAVIDRGADQNPVSGFRT